ncbi:hypothetical protein [Burkholderia stabilis]|uniref:hypothetical protein n=1 Tax=Burkholderia stabilis TaxID=95485 RepID=UPI0015901C33|nr:hypothetical protein [Burkholderia stabilis]
MTVQEPKVQRAAELLYDKDLPKTPCITLDSVISLIAKHGVDIPEGEAKQIEDFIEKRFGGSPMSQLQYGLIPAVALAHVKDAVWMCSLISFIFESSENCG